jgi:formamidopyrimidine-DNA glycosylase
MAGERFDRVVLNRFDLRRPFPTGFARRLHGQTVRALTRRGKYLLAELSSGDTLLMHLGMSDGSVSNRPGLRDDVEATQKSIS